MFNPFKCIKRRLVFMRRNNDRVKRYLDELEEILKLRNKKVNR